LKFSLIIPLWNEEKNIVELVRAINDGALMQNGMAELILVNNGSNDATGKLIEAEAQKNSWIVTVHLSENQNYGGGVYEGLKCAKSELCCYIPGDLQVMPDDVIKVYQSLRFSNHDQSKLFIKGWRKIRFDSLQTRIVSRVYNSLTNIFLGLHVKDVNGLPKMFYRNLVNLVPSERMKSFCFDAQLLAVARANNWIVEEIPVTFYNRREGVSKWSGKRITTYIRVFLQILKLRKIIKKIPKTSK